MEQPKSVLMLGGSGQAGAGAAALLRQWHPDLPLTIAGRNLARAQRVADDLGNATARTVDLRRDDLGLPADRAYAAVVAALWDSQSHALHYARRHRVPYVSFSSGLLDIAPEVVAGAQQPGAAPILMASHFCAGAAVLATLDAARAYDRIDSVRVGAVLDETDTGGPAGIADLERWTSVTSAGQVRRDGVFTWITGADVPTRVTASDGTALPGQAVAILDVPSLALATGAPNVRFDLAVGASPGRRGGGPASMELHIELDGTTPSGTRTATSRHLVHPEGQRPLTALSIALGVERLLALRGEPAPPPGLHTPESLIDPAYAVGRMTEVGATFV